MAEKLVLARAYWMDSPFKVGQAGFFVGNPETPFQGRFEGNNNLEYALRAANKKSADLSLSITRDFEGLARDEGMILLLQPIQDDVSNYKGLQEMIREYM